MASRRGKIVFIVTFCVDGRIDQVRAYSDVMKAQAALRRYVGYSELLRAVKRANLGLNASQAMMRAYAAINETRFAGTSVWELMVDERGPTRRPPRSG